MGSNVVGSFFFVAASFEPRSVRATLSSVKERQFDKAIVFRYEDTLDLKLAEGNMSQMREFLDSKVREVVSIDCSFRDPYSVVRNIESYFRSCLPKESVLDVTIDITCFTKLHLLTLLKYLDDYQPVRRISGLYTEPISYATAVGRPLSYGISRTVYLPYKEGNSRSRKIGLIAFLGHERLRLETIIQELEPDRLVVIFGEPGFSQNIEDYSRTVNASLLHRATFDPHYHLVSAPTRDVDATEVVLDRAVRRMQDDGCDSVYFAALGTKLQTIAVDRIRKGNLAVRMLLAYSIPKRYERAQYSLGSGSVHPVVFRRDTEWTLASRTDSAFSLHVDPIAETAVCHATLVESSLTIEGVAQRLQTTEGRVKGMVKRREIFSFLQGRRRLIPSFQFSERNALVRGISTVNVALRRDLELVEVYDWYTQPDADLECKDGLPKSPLEWLRAGFAVHKVYALAREL